MIIGAPDQPGQIDEARCMSDALRSPLDTALRSPVLRAQAVKSLRDSGGKAWLLG
jgi:hypothetical protein